MKIALVTSSESHVSNMLKSYYNAVVIDCAVPKAICMKKISTILPDILITYRCQHIIPNEIIKQIYMGMNIHPTLLPAYPGLNPWIDMMAANERNGGITIHRLSDIIDGGSIIAQQTIGLDFSMGLEWNRERTDILAAKMMRKILALYRTTSL